MFTGQVEMESWEETMSNQSTEQSNQGVRFIDECKKGLCLYFKNETLDFNFFYWNYAVDHQFIEDNL